MLALLCPGQGAQTPGMLAPWLELFDADGGADAFDIDEYSDAAGVDLRTHGTTSDADTIRDTAIAQPLIVATSLLAARALLGRPLAAADGVALAGHSVGEFAAAVLAGVLPDRAGLALVGERGRAMAADAARVPTGMNAVLGGDPADVAARLEQLDLVAANVNGAGQVVAAGSLEALEALRADPPAKARVVPLQVAGAFHTSFMAQAAQTVAGVAASLDPADPVVPLLSNADGAVVTSGADALARLAGQVASPVRWDLCQETLGGLGATAVVELAPGGVLTSLARRTLPGVPGIALKSPADLDAARAMLAEHGIATGTGAVPTPESNVTPGDS
ncbi:(Acyl-carrier-protein) S-malonyltransferase [Beutenbergia cavernae DSM 12333]|uniref:[acyl-carrier-protein] S-malonyltransferase n=1 Tax=Beutenbergia cavernae (strain ATCC BAA-8 / DSM 12333 / CCUG 43141 / JCM 11478 / NBRC 16432 / NCIMB 13614 / HKI 0122) TaxID=471853 RepID=C5C4T5_BEUC1|nr:ACP S-malonyltransferase [Beutenbergia cavernae]ACQ80063.1 (Acyl-carrier-protein) S-malonyltransferase [Beutenbergia cavernae DSM 12333]